MSVRAQVRDRSRDRCRACGVMQLDASHFGLAELDALVRALDLLAGGVQELAEELHAGDLMRVVVAEEADVANGSSAWRSSCFS